MNCAPSSFFRLCAIAGAAYGAMAHGAPVADRDAIIAFLDDLLDSNAFTDYGPNGIQVPGTPDVQRVVTGVSAHIDFFSRAIARDAQLLLCHHGIFWGGPLGPID